MTEPTTDLMETARKLRLGLPSLAANLRREGQTSRADVVDLTCRTLGALVAQIEGAQALRGTP